MTNTYLKKSRSAKAKTLDQFKIVQKQVENRESIVKNITSQLQQTDNEIESNESSLQQLHIKQEDVKETYASLLRSSYKQKLSGNNLVYILSSGSLKEAFLRAQYSKQLQNYTLQKSQLIQIQTDSIEGLLSSIQEEKIKKEKLLKESDKEKQKLSQTLLVKDKALKSIAKDEKKLLAELESQKQEKDKLAELIRIAISREIENTVESDDYVELSASFSENKGRLPWPVKNGVISHSFGERTHAINRNVKINNDGIDILSELGGVVKSIYDGKVTSINQIPGFFTVVIVKVGNYFLVYGKLNEVSVRAGDQVSRGQTLGRLAVDNDKSELQLQIWKGQTKLNPASWLIRK